MGCILLGSCIHEVFQARILEWIATPFSRGVIPIQGSNPSLLHWQTESLPSEPPGKYFIYSIVYMSVPNSKFIPPFFPGNLSSVSGNQESGFQHLFPTLYPLTHRYDFYVGKTLRILRGCFHYETHRVPGILLPVPCLRGRPLWAFWLASIH